MVSVKFITVSKKENMEKEKTDCAAVAGSGFSEANIQDLALVERLKSRDPKAFEALYRKYSPFISQYIFRKVHNQRLVEDLTHDILMKVYANIGKYKVRYTFSAWVWGVMKNFMVDYYRRDGKTVLSTMRNASIACEDMESEDARSQSMVFENSLPSEGYEADLRMLARERRDYVNNLLGFISERERRVVVMYFFEEKGYEQIAEELNMPLGTMKVLMLRAKEKMKRRIGGFGNIEGLLA